MKKTSLFRVYRGFYYHSYVGITTHFIDPYESTRDSHHFLLGLDFPRWGQVTELNLKSRADAEPRCLWQLTIDVFIFIFKAGYWEMDWFNPLRWKLYYRCFWWKFFCGVSVNKVYMTGNWINNTKFDLVRIAYRFAAWSILHSAFGSQAGAAYCGAFKKSLGCGRHKYTVVPGCVCRSPYFVVT